HGDPAIAADGDIEIATGFSHRTGAEIGGRAFAERVGTGGQAIAVEHAHRPRLLEIGAKAAGVGVGHVVGVYGLGAHDVLAAGHRDVDGFVHCLLTLEDRVP